MMKTRILKLFLAALLLGRISPATAAQAPQSAEEMSPLAIEGYWVSLVTEDWRFRMLAAPAGDYQGLALTPAGQRLADNWDPEADIAAGEQCKAYGAGGLMRIPTRLHIDWENENTLRIDTDAGRQTRLFRFGEARDGDGDRSAGSLQGFTRASWELQREGRFGPVVSGSLVAETTRMAPGYLRRNGVPYSDQAALTEYFEIVQGADGQDYLVVISELEDPVYLAGSVITSTSFKREDDASGWSPRDCVALPREGR